LPPRFANTNQFKLLPASAKGNGPEHLRCSGPFFFTLPWRWIVGNSWH
jgi:hypothetical protein